MEKVKWDSNPDRFAKLQVPKEYWQRDYVKGSETYLNLLEAMSDFETEVFENKASVAKKNKENKRKQSKKHKIH